MPANNPVKKAHFAALFCGLAGAAGKARGGQHAGKAG